VGVVAVGSAARSGMRRMELRSCSHRPTTRSLSAVLALIKSREFTMSSANMCKSRTCCSLWSLNSPFSSLTSFRSSVNAPSRIHT
jgi:hypothetical protein